MIYSLIGADGKTHLKIVGLALVAALLMGFAVNSSERAPLSKLQLVNMRSVAQADAKPVCRLNAL